MTALVRKATSADLDAIVALDHLRYGDVQNQPIDDAQRMFTARLRNCGGYFWVAEHEGEMVGLLSAQRSRYSPDDFESWEKCTNEGTFNGTGDPTSAIVYVAALTVSPKGSRADATDTLMASLAAQATIDGVKTILFSGRMPGFHRYASRMSAEEYYSATRNHGGTEVALDPQIHFYEAIGVKRHRLVENGFAADRESCGYAVLFTFDLPFYGWPLPRVWGAVARFIAERPKLVSWIAKTR